ncbi:hypothetical protein [Sphingobium sp. D43FB]|uniref:hypothetical protein n=1 Tax=Sphingobium sp. D43FB TaxID=2017595 RepID=UPI0015971430|nr:hypothetical protein [Sphingobium sp. D43FB]
MKLHGLDAQCVIHLQKLRLDRLDLQHMETVARVGQQAPRCTDIAIVIAGVGE